MEPKKKFISQFFEEKNRSKKNGLVHFLKKFNKNISQILCLQGLSCKNMLCFFLLDHNWQTRV